MHNLTNLGSFSQSQKPISGLALDFADVYVIWAWASTGKKE